MYNFLYINTHDTGRMISPYGYAVPTPGLKELAKDSVLFTNAYCCSPTCSPSRAAMLTGKYPHQNGMLGLAQRGFGLNHPEEHLAAHLAANGFRTAISGIQHEVGWYLDIDEEALHGLGYEEVLTTPADGYQKTELCDWDRKNAQAAAAWLGKQEADRPFMLSFGLHSTHRPFPETVAEGIDERYVRIPFWVEEDAGARQDYAQYMTSARHADDNIGIVLEALKANGLYDNTVILFTTDHGLAMPFHKCTLSDHGIGVSLILHHPDGRTGEVCDGLVSQIDIFPTICDLLGVKKREGLEGMSFAGYMTGEEKIGRRAVFGEINFHTSYEPVRCVRTDRYKYVRFYDPKWQKWNLSNMDESVPKDIYMENGLREREKPMEALYDCLYDPEETNNLIDHPQLAEIRRELAELLDEHLKRTKDPILEGELPVYPNYKVNKRECIQASSKNPEDYDERGRWK